MTATATVHRNASLAALLATPLALSACGGGGGGGVNSAATAPPPVATAPAPTPAPASVVSVNITTIPSPATRPGVYDTIAQVDRYLSGSPPGEARSRLAAPADVRITAYQPTSAPHDVSYTVQFAQQDLPAGLSSLTTVVPGRSYDASPNGSFGSYRDASRGQYPIKFGQDFAASAANSDGSQRTILSDRYANAAPDTTNATVYGKRFFHNATIDVGLSYVAFGSWAWGIDEPQSAGGNRIEAGVVRLVYGDRTPAGTVPTTGRASYTATAAGIGGGFASNSTDVIVHEALRFALVADFGQRSISTRITQDFRREIFVGDQSSGADVYLTPGLDLSGTGSLANIGSFSIPLTGTMTGYDPRNSQLPVFAPTTFAVSGALDGAFFGPAAEQVGGVFAVGLTPGTSLYSDAFVGTRD